jgi:hypothetical protein
LKRKVDQQEKVPKKLSSEQNQGPMLIFKVDLLRAPEIDEMAREWSMLPEACRKKGVFVDHSRSPAAFV